MIKGVGIDLIEINRIEKAIQKNERFVEKLFTEKEIKYFNSRNNKAETIAGNFAAKEAIAKALGTGVVFDWKSIEVLRTEQGQPVVTLYGKALALFQELGGSVIKVSIAHNKSNAIANCYID